MSTADPSWGARPDDATAVRHPVPRTDEEGFALPQPRPAHVHPDPAAEPMPATPAASDANPGATAVRPTAGSSDGSSPPWGGAPTAPVRPAAPAWSDQAPMPPPPPAWQHSAPLAAEALPPRKDDTRAALLGALIAAIVLISGGGGFYLTSSNKTPTSASSSPTTDFSGSLPAGGTSPDSRSSSGGDASGASTGDASSSGSIPDINSSPSSEAAPPVDPEAAALDQLNALHSSSVARVPLDGRWVAQVASKSVGITDPLQTTPTGSHTFMAVDILAESQQARQTVADPDQSVYLLWGTDFGKRSQAPNGSPYWITLVDAGFTSSNAVKRWCQSTYSSLTPAQLADTCAPRQLTPPHS